MIYSGLCPENRGRGGKVSFKKIRAGDDELFDK